MSSPAVSVQRNIAREPRLRRLGDPHAPWERFDTYAALVLGLLAVLMRLPYRARHLSTWDSVLYALSIDRFNVYEARPHAPGYPVYVAMAKAATAVTGDPNSGLVALAIVFGAISVAALYLLARRFGSQRMALAAAGLYLLAPVLVFNSAMATTYAGEAMFSVVLALLAWDFERRPGVRGAAVLGGVFLLALGFRQSLLFFLTPLVGYVLLRPRGDLRAAEHRVPWLHRLSAAGGTALAVGLVWLVPLVHFSGGLAKYRAATSLQTGMVVFANSVYTEGLSAWHDLWPRFQLYVEAERVALVPILALVMIAGVMLHLGTGGRVDWRRALALPGRAGIHVALWTLPALWFYLTVFNGWNEGPKGYILVVLPALYLLFALTVDTVLRAVELKLQGSRMARAAATFAIVALFLPAPALAAQWEPLVELEIRGHDDWVDSWLQVNEAFPPNETAIVASYSWAHVKWYHPEHILWSMMEIPVPDSENEWILTMQTQHREDDVTFYEAHVRGPSGIQHRLPDGIQRVLVYDFQLAGENGDTREIRADVEVKEAFLEDGWRVLYFETQDDRPFIGDYFIRPPNTLLGPTGQPLAQ